MARRAVRRPKAEETMTAIRFWVRAALLALALAATAAAPAHAQIGGLRDAARRAAQGVANGPAKAEAARPDSNVVEITPRVLDHLETILDIEAEIRDWTVKQEAARQAVAERREKHEACVANFRKGREAEHKALLERMQQAQGRGDLNAITALADTVRRAYERTLADEAKTCGPPPDSGAEANRSHELEQRRRAALTDSGLTQRQLSVVKERVLPFCKIARDAKDGPPLRVPGIGKGKSYVYTEQEAAAIAPRCETLLPRLQAAL
jgi:hypothetical protein